MFPRSPGLHLQVAAIPSLVLTTKNVSRYCKYLGDKNHTIETYCLWPASMWLPSCWGILWPHDACLWISYWLCIQIFLFLTCLEKLELSSFFLYRYQAIYSNLNRDSAFQQTGCHVYSVTDAHGDCSLPIAIYVTNSCWLVLSGKEPALYFSLQVHATILVEILIITFPFGGSLGTLFFIKIQITYQSYQKKDNWFKGASTRVTGSFLNMHY